MNFENQIQQWISVDNQLKIINEKVQDLRNKRNELTENITKYASTNNIINIPFSDGKLKLLNTKIQEPLTFKYLEKTLREIIKNETHVKQIIEQLKLKRSNKIIQEIKRFSNN